MPDAPIPAEANLGRRRSLGTALSSVLIGLAIGGVVIALTPSHSKPSREEQLRRLFHARYGFAAHGATMNGIVKNMREDVCPSKPPVFRAFVEEVAGTKFEEGDGLTVLRTEVTYLCPKRLPELDRAAKPEPTHA